ncbi:MAG: DNA cytosine methyltransferase [Candidatus Binatia bacterium]
MRSVELFAGAGGLGIGVSNAGFEPAVVIERDRYCCDTIRENKERGLVPLVSWPLHEGDVRTFEYGSVKGDVDLVSGGPPCQPFSICGKHRGHLDRRGMWPEAVRAVKELRPRAFIFENVKGLTRPAFSQYFEYIKFHLANPELPAKDDENWRDHMARLAHYKKKNDVCGRHPGLHYRVVSRILNAADYGIAQKRERVFIVGFRSDLKTEWNVPSPTHSEETLIWSQTYENDYWDRHGIARSKRHTDDSTARAGHPRIRSRPTLKPWRTVRDAIADLPDPELDPKSAGEYPNHRFQSGARSYPGHTGSPLDEPAKTLKAGDHGVPGGENMLRRLDGSVRYFSVRESARLQTFPDDFLFHGSWSETMRQLGNAVPVSLSAIVANSVLRDL